MADTVQAQAGSELKILLAGTDGKAIIRDKTGKDHYLAPLDMFDMLEFERRIGGSLIDENRTLKLADVMYLLYLSLRKGLSTPDEITAGKYKVTDQQVYRLFDLKILNKAGDLFTDIVKISGVELPPENPPTPSQE
jgi:hypothetical protein